MLWVLNLSDGWYSLQDIAEGAGYDFGTIRAVANTLLQHSLLEESGSKNAGAPGPHRAGSNHGECYQNRGRSDNKFTASWNSRWISFLPFPWRRRSRQTDARKLTCLGNQRQPVKLSCRMRLEHHRNQEARVRAMK
jgi:hypothetical protein